MEIDYLQHQDDHWEDIKLAKQRAEEEKLLPTLPPEWTNPMMLTMQLFMQRQKWDEDLKETPGCFKFRSRQTYVGQDAHFSSTPLHKLQPILLKDMKVRQHHKSKYFLCRIVAPPSRVVCTTLGVEDPAGWAQRVSLYNYPGTYSAIGQELDTIFPLNSVIAIREPYLKMAMVASHSHIRVDSPTDLIFIEPGSPVLKNVRWTMGVRPFPVLTRTANEWKSVGDKHFKAKEFYGAIAGYSFALQRNHLLIDVTLNRSLANLRVGRNIHAMEDARAVLANEQLPSVVRVKAMYRYAQGMYAEGNYAAAKEWYSKCLSVDPILADAINGIQRSDSRIKEQQSGSYDWPILFEQRVKGLAAQLDMADFQGPVEKRMMNHRGGGRGMVATRDIVAGELLVVSNPFASADPKVDATVNDFTAIDFLNNQMRTESQYILIQRAISRAACNHNDAEAVLDLYAGIKHSSSTADKSPDKSISKQANDIDSSKIEAVCLLNSFGGLGGKEVGVAPLTLDTPSLLYTLPSYFNHSCLPNAHREGMGKIMVIRAVRQIKKGAEITITYIPLDLSYEKRGNSLKQWIPRCDCSRCRDDRECGASKRRERQELSDRIEKSDLTIPQRGVIVKKIDSTYSSGYGWFRPNASMAHQGLARALESLSARKLQKDCLIAFQLIMESIQEDYKALEASGVRVLDQKTDIVRDTQDISLPISMARVPYDTSHCVLLCLHIVEKFTVLSNLRRAEMWTRAALWIESVWKGDSIELFKLRWPGFLKSIGDPAYVLLDKIALSKVKDRHAQSSGSRDS